MRMPFPKPTGEHSVGCADLMFGRSLSGSLLRIFYPCGPKDMQIGEYQWTKWFLGEEYTRGLASFIYPRLHWVISLIYNPRQDRLCIPCVWEAPIEEGTFPVVLFSHGLTTSRGISSSICMEIASHGIFVAALEHRDSSASMTFTLTEDGRKVFHQYHDVEKGFDEHVIRNQQLKIRTDEAIRALNCLEKLNEGNIDNDLPSSLDLRRFRNSLDLSKVVMSGHSFGGATTLSALATEKRFAAGVAFDPWIFPMRDEFESVAKEVKQPVLCISTENFQTMANLNFLKALDPEIATFVTIRDTVHLNQTDIVFFLTKIERWYFHALSSMDLLVAHRINISLALSFICQHLGIKETLRQRCDQYLEIHEDKLVWRLHGIANKMIGYDPIRYV